MTFLELCQRVYRESGTGGNAVVPATVTGQTGRNAKVVNWTNDAWRQIQNANASWLWMEADFAGQTVAGQRSYSGIDIGVAQRFGNFICAGADEDRYSIFRTVDGPADEGPLRFIDYRTFFTTFMRGEQKHDKPAHFTIAPDGKLTLHPIPDAAYTVRGPYRKDVQELAGDGDMPEMPARFHDLIADIALILLGTHDEAPTQIPLWQMQKMAKFSQLERDQLPQITFGGALA